MLFNCRTLQLEKWHYPAEGRYQKVLVTQLFGLILRWLATRGHCYSRSSRPHVPAPSTALDS